LISLVNQIELQSFTTVTQCLAYYATLSDRFIINNEPGPLVTDGLSLCLMSHNTTSYPKGGSTWYDMVNGLQFNSVGTQTPFTQLGPGNTNSFSFNGSGYWRCSSNYSLVDLGGDCTVIMWVFGLQGSNRRTIFQKNGTSYQSYQQEIAITWETNSSFSYYSRQNPVYDYASMPATTFNDWSMVALKMSTGLTSAPRTGFYSLNGGAWVASYNSRSSVALLPAADILIGSGYAGTCSSGGIGSVMCYNKMLSDAEISQVFIATRGAYYAVM